ncbi:POK18 protein, partial [Oreocharis arfaki]|nr:POK18 protein [Oreocharis arfaki]
AQKLLGILNWLRLYLRLTTAELSPSFDILKGDPDLNLPRTLTPEVQQALGEVQHAVSTRQVYQEDPSIDVVVFVAIPDFRPTGIIGQWNDQWPDPLHIL